MTMRTIAAVAALVVAAAGLAQPAPPAGVDLAALLRASTPADLQKALDAVKGDGPPGRWVRARLDERMAEVLSAAGLVGPAGEAAAKGLRECGADGWEVAARLHLMLARFLDDLGPDRRDAYDLLRGRTADGEVAAADEVAKKLGDGFAAHVLAREVDGLRAYRTCRAQPDADPEKLLGPIADDLRKLKASAAAAGKALAARAVWRR